MLICSASRMSIRRYRTLRMRRSTCWHNQAEKLFKIS